jgi:hypothetical protein
MATHDEGDPDSALLLVAIVQMAAGHAEAGQTYEDFVLARLGQHGGVLERRTRTADDGSEVHLIRFSDRAGYESFLADPDRAAYRERLGAAAPTTKVLEVRDVP